MHMPSGLPIRLKALQSSQLEVCTGARRYMAGCTVGLDPQKACCLDSAGRSLHAPLLRLSLPLQGRRAWPRRRARPPGAPCKVEKPSAAAASPSRSGSLLDLQLMNDGALGAGSMHKRWALWALYRGTGTSTGVDPSQRVMCFHLPSQLL